MSKSIGNVMLLHELLQKHPPELLRYLLLKAHYRQPLDWSDTAIAQARATLDGWYGALRDLGDVDAEASETSPEVEAVLLDDLNTPEAFAIVARLASTSRQAAPGDRKAAKAALLGAGAMLGLLKMDPETWFKQGVSRPSEGATPTPGAAAINPDEIDALIEQRNAARKSRNFAEADRIRDELAAKNIAIEDSAQGTRWKVVNPNERAA
jgi:cysteinyl-tRNA synthetase